MKKGRCFLLGRKLAISIFILSIVFTVSQLNNRHDTIPEDSIRLRIIANSNTDIDQSVKLEIRDAVIAHLNTKLEHVGDYEEARVILYQEIDAINQVVNRVLVKNDIDTTYYVDYGLTNFPSKVHGNKLYQGGEYESVYIVLGEGKGDNWWCVLFPPLCLVDLQIEDGEIQDRGEVQYSFYFIEKIKELFRSK